VVAATITALARKTQSIKRSGSSVKALAPGGIAAGTHSFNEKMYRWPPEQILDFYFIY
jgi:hypothetical protein